MPLSQQRSRYTDPPCASALGQVWQQNVATSYQEPLLRAVYHLLPRDSAIRQQYEAATIGRADERAARRATAAAGETGDGAEEREEEGFDEEFDVPEQHRLSSNVARVHSATTAWFNRILQEMDAYDESGLDSGRNLSVNGSLHSLDRMIR